MKVVDVGERGRARLGHAMYSKRGEAAEVQLQS